MKQRLTPIGRHGVGTDATRQAAALAGGRAAAPSPLQLAQGERIAQLQSAATATAQLNGERKTQGFNRGSSHSRTTPSGKTTSHKPGKGREENPRKSAAKNRKRDRMLKTAVANSQNKQ